MHTHTTQIAIRRTLIAAAVSLAFAAPALADPAAGSAYFTDRQESFVFDQTSEKIGTVNMIACIIDRMNPVEMVNRGPYIALVDMNRCDTERRSDASRSSDTGGSASATDYMRAIVDSTRASTSDPMRVKGWAEPEEGGGRQDISINISVAAPPSDSNPYGQFHMDYKGMATIGTNPPVEHMRGFLIGSATGLQWAEREIDMHGSGGPVTRNNRLYLTKGAGDSGAGAVEQSEVGGTSTTFRFAYDATHFRRQEVGGADRCFDRSLSNAESSVWRYGLYDAAGARVERNSGFPIEFAAGGHTYNGYASFWGINLPPDAMTALTDGSTVTKREFGEGGRATAYTVQRARGKLMKYTRRSATLAEFSGSRFMFFPWGGLTDATANAIAPGATGMTIRARQLEAYWDNDAHVFKIAALQSCNDSGCRSVDLAAPVTLTNTDLAMYPTGFQGWSNSFGGPVGISATVLSSVIAGTPAGNVFYRSQDVVNPGAAGAPTALYCSANCPTASDIAAFVASRASPFGATADHFFAAGSTVTYNFNGSTGNLELAGTPAVIGPSVDDSSFRGTPYQWGIRSGKMVTRLADLECAPASGTYCEMKAEDLDIYYVWETGPSSWNQYVGLSSGGVAVRFDPPLQLNYAVPNLASFGEFRGRTLVLQYDGFGQLQGIPGHCVDPRTNRPAACADGMRYVARFSIPYDDTPDATSPNVVTDSHGARYYVKWLNREVRFAPAADATACNALVLGDTANLPNVSAVQILIDGRQVDTLAGHLDLRYPLGKSSDWVRKGP